MHDVPERILDAMCGDFAEFGMEFLPIEIIYTMLNAITTQLALFAYILMFVSVLTEESTRNRLHQVPGAAGLSYCVLEWHVDCCSCDTWLRSSTRAGYTTGAVL